jgi:phosphotriesterase-related protein
LAILNEEGVDPSAWIWVHAQGESDTSRHAEAAGQGAWVALDGLSPDTAGRHLDLLRFMKSEQLLHRVLLSHDAGWYSVGEENGGEFRGYDFLFSVFVDRLREAGFTEEELHRLTVSNPAEAFTIAKRLRSSG